MLSDAKCELRFVLPERRSERLNGIIDRITWRTKLTSRDWKRTRSVLKREHSLRNAPVNTFADIVGLFESCVLSVPKLSPHHHGIIYTRTPLYATHATFFATLPPSRRFLRTSAFTVLVDPTNTDSLLHDVTRLPNIAIVIAGSVFEIPRYTFLFTLAGRVRQVGKRALRTERTS